MSFYGFPGGGYGRGGRGGFFGPGMPFPGFGSPMPMPFPPFGGGPGPGFLDIPGTGFGVKPSTLFGSSDTFKPAKPFTGTPQPLFGTDSTSSETGSGTPKPLFGPDSPYGKRPSSGGDASKKAKKSRFEPVDVVKPKKEVIFGRDMSYGTQKCDPNAPPKEDDEKDDALIKVDKILTNPKFNVWNLPSKAKVLLMSNIPLNVANPRFIFNICSFYGDVYRVKVLKNKLNAAFIEYATATQAAIARDNLDGFVWCGQKLVVSFARTDTVKAPQDWSEANFFQSFDVPEYKMMHRFAKEEIIRANLQRIVPPRQYLVVANIPVGKSPQEIANLFAETGLNVTDMIGYRSLPTRKQQIESAATGVPYKVRAMISFKLDTASDAALAMAYFNGKFSSIDVPEGLRVSFSLNTTENERGKEHRGWQVISNFEHF